MLTIVWDVDDVLNDLMYQWFHHAWMNEHPECALGFSALSQNPPHVALGIERQEYLASMDQFRMTERALRMQPNSTILAWLTQNGHRFRHVALTARPLETAPDVAAWVIRHFGAWIRCFGVVPTRFNPAVPVYDRSKIEFLKWLRTGDILIDDADENIEAGRSLGMKAYQVSQPWNKSTLTTAAILAHLSELGASSGPDLKSDCTNPGNSH